MLLSLSMNNGFIHFNIFFVAAALLLNATAAPPLYAETSILSTLIKASESVVHIESENSKIVRGLDSKTRLHAGTLTYIRSGTGVIIAPNGIIATNAHVVLQAQTIRVYLATGESLTAVPQVVDIANDLCLLKIYRPAPLPYLPLADVSKTALHSRVYSIGGSELLKNTLSEGIITGIGFSKQLRKQAARRKARDIKLFQVSIDLYQGDSGSPLFNPAGEVIGIITATAQLRGKTTYAIPASLISLHLSRLTHQAAKIA